MDTPAAQLLKQVRTLSAAGLGSSVQRPAESMDMVFGGLRDAGLVEAGVYLFSDERLTPWQGARFPVVRGLGAEDLHDGQELGGACVHLIHDDDGDALGALIVRGQGELGGARAIVRGHLRAELTERGYLGAVFALAEGVEAQDEAIAGHVRRTSGYSEVIARTHGCDPEFIRLLRLASPLHDLGKVMIPNAVLYKPGKLTDEEFAATKRHTEEGAVVLSRGEGPLWTLASEIAVAHHERWDGSGYPHGLAGEAIPLGARIVAVADVFDALTTKRIYKPALGIEQSLNIISEGSGRHFDPELVDAFQRAFSEILDVKTRESSP